MWQDYVFALGSVVFIVALMPAVKSKEKLPLGTSIPTAVILFLFAICYATLHLWFAMATTLGTATQWSLLAIQKLRQSKS